MWLLAAIACTCSEPVQEALAPEGDELPPGWWWVTGPELGFEVTFPGVPLVLDKAEDLDLGGGRVSLPARRFQVASGTSSFSVSVVDLPDDALSVGASALVARAMDSRASGLNAELVDRGPWSVSRFDAAEQAGLETGRPGESLLRMGVEDGNLWIVQGVGDRAGPGSRFVSSFRRVELAPHRTDIGSGAVGCPARCGATGDRVEVAGGLEPLPTLRGVIGRDKFEVAALRIPAGVGPKVALKALEQRAVRRSRGQVVSEADEPSGRVLELRAGRGWYRVRLVASSDTAYALEVFSPAGGAPDWAASFLSSLEM